MAAPDDPTREFMRRSLFNLRYIELSADPEGQQRLLLGKDPELRAAIPRKRMNTAGFHRGLPTFEFTALVNTFLMCLVHPWEVYHDQTLDAWTVDEAAQAWELPILRLTRNGADVDVQTVVQLVTLLRNSLSHGNIRVSPDAGNSIWLVELWNIPFTPKSQPTAPESKWTRTFLTPKVMRDFLFAFVRMTEDLMFDGGASARIRIESQKLAEA
jgi:hypothetical protein